MESERIVLAEESYMQVQCRNIIILIIIIVA